MAMSPVGLGTKNDCWWESVAIYQADNWSVQIVVSCEAVGKNLSLNHESLCSNDQWRLRRVIVCYSDL
jgi:hypothetical protein